MLTPGEQDRAWEGLYLAEMRAAYYADVANACRRKYKLMSGAALFLSSGAVIGVVASAPGWVAAALSFISAGLTVSTQLLELEKAAVECAEMADRQNRLAQDYERLWGTTYADDASTRLMGLEERRAQLSHDALRLPAVDESRMLRWQKYVDRQHAIDRAA